MGELETTAEKKDVYLAIGAVPGEASKRKVLDWATSGEVKLQDFFYPILSVSSSSSEGLETAWSYLQEHFHRIYDLIKKASPSLMAAVVTYSCGDFSSHDRADEIEAFFEKNSVPLISRKVSQIIEKTRSNASFKKRILASSAFSEFLAKVSK